MYQKGISVNSCPFSTYDMGIADSHRMICPKLMSLRVRHVFLTVKTVLVGGNDRMAQPAQNSPAFILPLISPSKNKFLGKYKAPGSGQYNRSCPAF